MKDISDGTDNTLLVREGDGEPAMAYTNNGGKYALIFGRGNDQVPVGEYKVAVRVFTEDPNLKIPKFKLPPTYTKTEETELRPGSQVGL